MKCICRLSGIEFETSGAFKYVRAISTHPIMNFSKSELIPIYNAWKDGRLSLTESKLLFIALLNSSELIDFKFPATPAEDIILLHMEKVHSHVMSMDQVGEFRRVFPGYTVHKDTASLRNLHTILARWDECKEAWEDRYKRANLREKLEGLETLLYKHLNSPNRDNARYLDVLARWTFGATKVPPEKRELWMKLWKLSGPDLFSDGIRDDVEELHNFVQLKLLEAWSENSGWYASEAKKHVAKLWNLVAKGLDGYFDSVQIEETEEEALGVKPPNWHFPDEIETHNVKIAASHAPLVEPKRSSFPADKFGNIAFAIAKSGWVNASKLRREAEERAAMDRKEEVAETLEDISRKEDIDNGVIASEEAEELVHIFPGSRLLKKRSS